MRFAEEVLKLGYFVREHVLTAEEVSAMNAYVSAHGPDFKAAKVGKAVNHRQNSDVRSDETLWLDLQNVAPVFRPALDVIEALKRDLNRELFLGLKDVECHLAKYPPGAFYKKHLDKFKTDSSRTFSFIFYLNQDWRPGDGGELKLYDRQDYFLKTVEPRAGTLVGFLSQDFPHEVLEAHRERRSLTGWIHNKGLSP